MRVCRVFVRGADGFTHSIEVHAASLFEAAATALASFREEGWGADALAPNAVLRVEVQMPAVVQDVPLKAVERWLRSSSASPREYATNRAARTSNPSPERPV